ncbi:hypothetical protein B484DRAFT_454394 [Ochromonadaceae sp. CCMP2298]|nr:hypothetical protein B484DRAFT_454394 [Ochromonadaceae sp. CCMP2298]
MFRSIAVLAMLLAVFSRSLGLSMRSKSISSTKQNIILYDGVCNFCNSWVDLLLKLDRKKKFSFAALQSDEGQDLLQRIGKSRDDLSSVVFIQSLAEGGPSAEDKVYFKSDAAIRVAEELTGAPGPIASLITAGFPKSMRDTLYDGVATNRYSILGKREECRCSDATSPERFL